MKSLLLPATLLLASQIAALDLAAIAPFPSLVPVERLEELLAAPAGMIVVEPETSEVVVARIESDGTRVMGCVDNQAAANAFLTAPKSKSEQ